MEKRNFKIEFKASETGRTIFGTATVLNKYYDMGWFDETIDPTAFDKADMSDVVALFNHDANMVLARSSSGTLNLSITDKALEYSFEAPNTTLGNDLLEMIKRGDIYQSSFAFIVEKDLWYEENGMKPRRRITEINKVYDIAPVTYPANHDTMVATRSFELMAKKEKEMTEQEIADKNEIRRYALHLINLQNQTK